MNKLATSIMMVVACTALHAEDVSDECLHSMQSVYKFYYHEILPKGDQNNSDKLGPQETAEMETVIGKLKSSCPPEVIAKMNHFLQVESAQG